MGNARRIGAIVATFAALATVPALSAQTYPTGNDPRNGLKPGRLDAGTAASGMSLVSFSPKPAVFDSTRGLTFINSDVAFSDHYVYQGNFAGFIDLGREEPREAGQRRCGSVHHVAGRPVDHRHTCSSSPPRAMAIATTAPRAVVGTRLTNDPHGRRPHLSMSRIRRAPKLVKNVQTCKGSHTHTVDPEPDRPEHRLPLRLGESACASGRSSWRDARTARIPPTRQLAVSARHHQGAARSSRAGRGRDGCADLHGP